MFKKEAPIEAEGANGEPEIERESPETKDEPCYGKKDRPGFNQFPVLAASNAAIVALVRYLYAAQPGNDPAAVLGRTTVFPLE